MKQDDLQKLYRSWSNDKLIETYKKRFDYTETAQASMLLVLEERNLMGAVDEAISKSLEEREQTTATGKKKFEEKILGDSSDAKVFAEKSRVGGEYMRGPVVTGRSVGIRVMLVSGAIFFFVMAIVFLFTVKGFLYIPLPGMAIGILLFIYWVRLYKNSKGVFVFHRQDQADFFEVQQGSFSFKAKIPFNYFVYYSAVDINGTVGNSKQLVTGIVICNDEEKAVAFEANQYRIPIAPPGWQERFSVEIPEGTKFFTEMLGHRLNIVKLKKILDGLHDETEKFI